MTIVKIAEDFSPNPGPRYKSEGIHSGEVFRNTLLIPAIENALFKNDKILIDLDDTNGYEAGFLEEAFGGLIRLDFFDLSLIKNVIVIKSDQEPYLINEIYETLENAYKSRGFRLLKEDDDYE